ncbi:MAG: hypothetical protein HKN31_00320, partial [Pricia sp.]|nr:hypothetical protein [Pricia sp.]
MTRLQVFKYLAVLLLGCCLTLFIFFSINNRSQVRNRTIIDNAVARSELKLEDELNKINLVMESMGFFFEHSPNISQKVFERYTAPFLLELNGIRALEWAPKVEDSE